MRTIWKYPVEIARIFFLEMPEDAEILCVQNQKGDAQIWALVDPDAPKRRYKFRMAGTGHPIEDEENLKYVGTFQETIGEANLVWHVFQVIEGEEQEG